MMIRKARTSGAIDVAALTRADFARLLGYPEAWLAWEMYPEELFGVQRAHYEAGDERAGEHFRYGAFDWWLASELSNEHVAKLTALSFLDPDQGMATSARADIAKSLPSGSELQALLSLKVP